MTKRYPGGYITKTPPTVSTTSAPGIWTMEQQAAYQKAGTWPFGGPFNYIEDVFSTWLYTGNGSTQTITNGIDLTTYGGLTWLKQRNDSVGHRLYDTARGATNLLESNGTAAQSTSSTGLTAFTSSGFSLGNDPDSNTNSGTYASWTFRKQPKFFDVVTYTGDGVNGRAISHSLGSVPGVMIIKKTSSGGAWVVYHRSLGSGYYINLNTTSAATYDGFGNVWAYTNPTSTDFTVGSSGDLNASGATYVAYLFAHNAGGFGLTGTDNVISCGSYTGNGDANGLDVSLGYEPQWVLVKESSASGNNWLVVDNMRGMTANMDSAVLYPSGSFAEAALTRIGATATGFKVWGGSGTVNNNGSTYIYIAIRRGPMKTPTSGTSVFNPIINTPSTSPTTINTTITGDMYIRRTRASVDNNWIWDRLRGTGQGLITNSTGAELALGSNYGFTGQASIIDDVSTGVSSVYEVFKRAPSFFDEVCFNGATTSPNHNLGVVPEMMIFKRRSATSDWVVGTASLGWTNAAYLNKIDPAGGDGAFNNTAPTATQFSQGYGGTANYVAYLFASCPGVSKVGSYTGTGTTKQIDCGFTGGARFVLIKRTDDSGDWYVWDSARGIVAGNDPYLLLNSTAAEVTNTDYVDAYAAGFEISSTAPAAINANGGSFIFLAVA